MDIASPEFWVAVLQIIAIDIVLGGDNAIVILRPNHQLHTHVVDNPIIKLKLGILNRTILGKSKKHARGQL